MTPMLIDPTWFVCVVCNTRAEMCRTCTRPGQKKVFFCPRCGCISCRRAWSHEHGRFIPMLRRQPFVGWFLIMPAAREGLPGAIRVERAMSDVALRDELRRCGQLGAAKKLEHIIAENLAAEIDLLLEDLRLEHENFLERMEYIKKKSGLVKND